MIIEFLKGVVDVLANFFLYCISLIITFFAVYLLITVLAYFLKWT